MIKSDPLTEEALALHKQGLRVFPADHPDQPHCIGKHGPDTPCDGKRGKHPAIKWSVWPIAATPQMIEMAWERQGGMANIAVSCGPSNIVVLDEDELGELDRWCADHEITLPPTYTVDTGRAGGGRHHYFYWNHGTQRIGNCEKALKNYKINVRGHGGYVIGEGSKHESGVTYTGNGLPIADLPQEVADLLLAAASQPGPQSGSQPSSQSIWNQPAAGDPNTTMIRDGERHNILVVYAGRLLGKGLDYSEAEAAFHKRWLLCEQPDAQIPEAQFHTPTCRYPVTWDEAKAKLADVYSRYPAGGAGAKDEDESMTTDAAGKAKTDGKVAPPPWARLDNRLLSAGGLANLPEPAPLIDNVLDLGTTALLYGKWGTLKTFIALDWSASVATGRDWQGRATKQCKALYVAAEGAFGYRARVAAWQQGWGIDLPDGDFTLLPDPVNLTNGSEVGALCALIEHYGYGFVVIDTLARCMVGADENSARDCGVVIGSLGRLGDATPDQRGVILGVHHAGKDGRTLRGSSAFEGAADTVYFTDRDKDSPAVSLDREKRRDGPEKDHHDLRLNRVDGTESGVIVAFTEEQQARRNTDRDARLIRIFVEHFSVEGCSRSELLRVALADGMTEMTFRRALNDLLDHGDLVNDSTTSRTHYRTP